jgi:two-component system, OmpR family, sensor histidine kinase SenX3
MISGRRRSVIFFTVLGICLVALAVTLNISWVVLNWHRAVLVVLGIVLFIPIIAGMVLNTIFLVREIRRNEQHDSFINAVTHELKTPVASIRLYLQTLQSRELDDEKRREFYRIMLEDSERLLGTIEQILRTGRIGVARRTLNLSEIEVGSVVQECLARLRTIHHVPESALAYEPGPPVTIRGDMDEVRAAVSNLIDNAVKYSGKEPQVTVEVAQEEGKFATVRVRDRGPGIPKSELKQVFKRFYRVPGPMSSTVKGTGLGLFIVRSVAKRHRGRAWAESEGPGRGSTFILQLPIAQ